MLTAGEMTRAETEVLAQLNQPHVIMSPNQLVDALARQGVREDLVRRAVWRLIDQRQITLTSNWRLTSKVAEQAAAR